MNKILTAILSGVLATTAMAADVPASFNPSVLAGLKDADNYISVNGKPVMTVGEFKEVLQAASGGAPGRADAIADEVRKQIVTVEVLDQDARNQKFDQTPEYKQVVKVATANAWSQELAQKLQPTEAQVKDFYQKNVVDALKGKKEYQVRHILVKDEATAKKIIADLQKKRTTFEKAAAQSLDKGTASAGGELGWNEPKGTFVPEFAEAVTAAPVGKLYDKPVKTQFGYHIIEVQGARDIQVPKLEDIQGNIENALVQQNVREYVENLSTKAKVDVAQPKK